MMHTRIIPQSEWRAMSIEEHNAAEERGEQPEAPPRRPGLRLHLDLTKAEIDQLVEMARGPNVRVDTVVRDIVRRALA